MEISSFLQKIWTNGKILLLSMIVNIFVIGADLLNPEIAGVLPNCSRSTCSEYGFSSAAFSIESVKPWIILTLFIWILLSFAVWNPRIGFTITLIIVLFLITFRSLMVFPIYLYSILTGDYVEFPLIIWTLFWIPVYGGFRIWRDQNKSPWELANDS